MTTQTDLLGLIKQIHVEKQKIVSHQYPFDSGKKAIKGFYKGICADIQRSTQTNAEVEYEHYGSGYASFIDAWFYKTTKEFEAEPYPDSESYTGLVVLLNRHVPYFVMFEAKKVWSTKNKTASSYLPNFDSIDDIETSEVNKLSQKVEVLLNGYGLTRLRKHDVAEVLPKKEGWNIPTILNYGGYTYFDGLFFWAD